MRNSREIIQRTMEGERNERLPRALFGGGLWAYKQAGLRIEDIAGGADRFAAALSPLYAELDTDILFLGSGLNSFPAEAIGGTLAFRGAQAPLLAHPLLHTREEVQRCGQIDLSASPYTLSLVRMIGGMRKNFPERFLCVTSWGPFTWAMILCDWDLLKEKLVTDRMFIREVGELGVRLSSALFDLLIDQGLVDGISITGGSNTLMPDEEYRELILPLQQRLFGHVQQRGVRCFLHQCGEIRSQLPLYPLTGADCITVDDHIALREAYDLYHEKLVTAGNVPVIDVIEKGEPDSIRRAVAACVSQVKDPFLRYILMPSCDLPLNTPLRNVKEFLSCADRADVQGK
ncbi:MAG: uroporphyrinogen decarboxylase family protein [Thermodesulfovibrionales bacterium]